MARVFSDEDRQRLERVRGQTRAPDQNTGLLGDLGTDVKRGALQIPGALAGVPDILFGAVTGTAPVTAAADWLGEQTGFQPGRWADEAVSEYSPARQEARREIDRAWSEGGVGNIAGAYARNPSSVLGLVAESLPATVAGGALGWGARAATAARVGPAVQAAGAQAANWGVRASAVAPGAPLILKQATRYRLSLPVAAGIGEGAIAGGMAMNELIDKDVDPRRAAMASLGTGAVTGALGYAGGRIAQRLGLIDPELLATGGREAIPQALGEAARGGLRAGAARVGGRMLRGGAAEGLLEELPQSVQEKMWSNWATGRPLMEGVPRAAVEGTLAGFGMGAGANLISPRPAQNLTAAPPQGGVLDTTDTEQSAADEDMADITAALGDAMAERVASGNAPASVLQQIETNPDLVPREVAPGVLYTPATGVYTTRAAAEETPLGRAPRQAPPSQGDLLEGLPFYAQGMGGTAPSEFDIGPPAPQAAPQGEQLPLVPLSTVEAALREQGDTGGFFKRDGTLNAKAARRVQRLLGMTEAELAAEVAKPRANALVRAVAQARQAPQEAPAAQGPVEVAAVEQVLRNTPAAAGLMTKAGQLNSATRKRVAELVGMEPERLQAALARSPENPVVQTVARLRGLTGGAQNAVQEQGPAPRAVGQEPETRPRVGRKVPARRPAREGRQERGQEAQAEAPTQEAVEASQQRLQAATAVPEYVTRRFVWRKDMAEGSAALDEVRSQYRGEIDPDTLEAFGIEAEDVKTGDYTTLLEAVPAVKRAEGTAGMFAVFHALAKLRNRTLNVMASTTGLEKSAERTLASIYKQGGSADFDALFQAVVDGNFAGLNRITEAMVELAAEIENRVGTNNLSLVQKEGKAKLGGRVLAESEPAILFSQFYADLKTGAISKDRPAGGMPTQREIRERKELKDFKQSRLYELYQNGWSLNAKVKYEGAQAVLMYIRHQGGTNLLARNLASALYHAFKKAPGMQPSMVFYTSEGAIVPSKSGKSASIDKTRQAPSPLAEYDPNTNTVHVGPKGHDPQIVLHELLHAATVGWMAENQDSPEMQALTAIRDAAVKKLRAKTSRTPTEQMFLEQLDAAGGVFELVSYGLTNADMAALLKTVSVPTAPAYKSVMERIRGGWNALVQVVRKILGLNDAAQNAFDDFITSALSLLESVKQTGPRAAPAGIGRLRASAAPAGRSVRSFTEGAQSRENLADRITRGAFSSVGLTPARLKRGSELAKKRVADAVQALFPGFDGNLFFDFYGKGSAIQKWYERRQAALTRPNSVARALANLGEITPELEMDMGRWLAADTEAERAAVLAQLPAGPAQMLRDFRENMEKIIREAQAMGYQSLAGLSMLEAVQWIKDKADVRVGKTFNAEVKGIKVLLDSQRARIADSKISGEAEYYYMILDDVTKDPVGAVAVDSVTPALEKVVDRSRRFRRGGSSLGYTNFVRSATLEEARRGAEHVQLHQHLANTLIELSRQVYQARFADEMLADNAALAEDGRYIHEPEAFQQWWKKTYPDSRPALIVWNENIGPGEESWNKARLPSYWVQVPDTAKWGALRGKVINGSAWASMLDIHDSHPVAGTGGWSWLAPMMRWWKSTKTVLSPAVHFTNAVTNLTMMYMHDVPPAALRRGMGAMWAHFKHEATGTPIPAEYREVLNAFMDSGALLGEFRGNEIERDILARMAQDLPDAPNTSGGLTHMLAQLEGNKRRILADAQDKATKLGRAAVKGFDVAAAMYALEDNAFRMAAFLNHLENKRLATGQADFTEADFLEAGRFAKTAFVNYDINARWVQGLRRTVLPFFAWPYRMLPMMARITAEKPWKIVNMLSAVAMLNALAWAGSGEDEDEYRRNMPEYARERIFGFGPYAFAAMPFLGGNGEQGFLNIGKYIPHGDMLGQEMFGQSWIPSMFVPSGPLMSLYNWATGYDPFTQKQIYKETLTQPENFAEGLKFLGGQFAPGFNYTQLIELLEKGGKMGPTGSDPSTMYLLTRQFGPKLYNINIEDARYSKAIEIMSKKREYRTEMAKIMRDEMRFPTPDFEGALDKRRQLEERWMQEWQDFFKE